MKKNYKRIIKGILILCLSFFLCLDVKAEKKCLDIGGYGEEVTNNDNGTITATAKTSAIKNIEDRAKVKFTVIQFTDGIYTDKQELNAGSEVTFNYQFKQEEQEITLVYIYTGTDGCYKDGQTIVDEINKNHNYNYNDENNTEGMSIYINEYNVTVPGSAAKSDVANEHYNTICKDFREGRWNSKFGAYITQADFEKYNPTATNSESEYKGYISYCYNSTVSMKYGEDDILYNIGSAIRTYKFRHRTLENNKPVEIPADSEKTFTNTSNLNVSLTCDILNLGTKSTEYQYVNKHKYTAVETTQETYKINKKTYTCTKVCTEVLTVEYGPPVASKAGLCFEYRVKVKSEVTCQTEGTDVSPPSTNDYSYCEPVATCTSKSGKTTSSDAGPNEDFDKCINECDNGKYTQKCINKCYKQVYTESTSQRLNYTDKVEAKKMKECNAILNNYKANAATLSSLITNATDTDCFGYYVKDANGNITWKKGTGGYWTQYARYYFLNSERAGTTINQDVNNMEEGNGKIVKNDIRYYGPTEQGFKTWLKYKDVNTGKIGGATCDYTCKYIGCSNEKYLNKNEAMKNYKDDMDKYNEFINECTAEASCSTSIAEFTIKVNNKTKDNPDKDNWINYGISTLQNTGSSVNINDDKNIILDRSDCYGETINKNKYMTEWSFPGTWINNKTGEISYKPKTDPTWHKKQDKFCISLNSANANAGWWYYGLTGEKKNITTNEAMTDAELKAAVTDYNIEASTEEFGHFGWNIDISCFYSLYDTSGEECKGPNCDDSCTGSNCDNKDKNPSQRYRIRTVDNGDLFPSTEGNDTTDATKTGRTPGFNWTVKATNIKNKNYIIAPSALLAEIQQKGDSIYSDDNNVDYEFYLDRTALSSIRKDTNTTSGNYTNYTGNFTIVNGVSVYNSSLFRKTGSPLDSKYVKRLGVLGCNNEENGKCYNYSSITSIGG